MVHILAESVKESRKREEAAIKAALERAEKYRLKFDKDTHLLRIRQSSEIPQHILVKVVSNKIDVNAVYILYGVDHQRVDELIQAFGLKG